MNIFNTFCKVNGITRQLFAPKTPEHNGIVERRNQSIVEAAKVMFFENDVSKTFWREAINIEVYTLNRVQIIKGLSKTPYELWFSHSPLVKYFRIFGSKCYIKRDDDVGKCDPRSDEGTFIGYSLESKAYRCFNHRTKTIVECTNVKVDENFIIKEKIMDYNSNEEEDNTRIRS